MEKRPVYSEEFLGALGQSRREMDRLLTAFVRVLGSEALTEAQKMEFRDRVVAIGQESSAFFSSVKLEAIDALNVRDVESRILANLRATRAGIVSFMRDAARKGIPEPEANALFSPQDVVQMLGATRFQGAYAMTKDKVENLLAVKKFCLKLSDSITAEARKKETELEKELLRVKEKTFLEVLRNSEASNAEYFLKSMTIVRKFIGEGKPVRICDADADTGNLDEILFFVRGESTIELRYKCNGLWLSMIAAKGARKDGIGHSVKGFIEKGVYRVEYRFDVTLPPGALEQKERLLGLDYLWSLFDRVYLETKGRYDDGQRRQEAASKAAVDKAIDDILF